MKKILIFGTSDFAEVVFETISQDNPEIEILGFVLDDAFCNEENFCDKPVYKYSSLKNKFSPAEIGILVCIGYGKMNKNREEIFHRLQKDGWKIADYISKKAVVRTENLGVGNIILDDADIGIKCKIGDGNIFYPGALFAHHSDAGNFNFFAIRSSVAGKVKVGNCCFFGNNCCTKDNINIADETLIGAGCYVSTDTEFGGVYVPNKMIKLDKSSLEISGSLVRR